MKYALVTGGSRGLGRAVCLKLAEMGIPVVINYQSSEQAAQEVKTECEAQGVQAELLKFNVGDMEAVNAAIDQWEDGFFYVTRKVLPKMMMRKHGGSIVNMASVTGLKGMPGQTNYGAAKGGIIAATKSLALEVAARNVTVNAVAPGFIESDMTKDLDKDALVPLIPTKRFGKPEEVAALVGFLLSENARYITGEVISINGGLYT